MPLSTTAARTASSWRSRRQRSRTDRRVAALQREFRRPPTFMPPPGASTWPDELLRAWFEDGGNVTVDAAVSAEIKAGKSYLEHVGVGLPVQMMRALEIEGGLLGASERGDRSIFDALGLMIANQGYALADLGAPEGLWSAACDEGRRLWPSMKVGELTDRHGKLHRAKDPSGNERGDRYIESSRAAREGDYPALATLDEALALVGVEINTSIRNVLMCRSDPYFACFPGGGARYGAHFDGGGINPACKITSMVYCNEGWSEEDGGLLQLLDERRRCWHAVQPRAGRVVLFRADTTLHRVEPTHRVRYALTAWWYASPDGAAGTEGEARLIDGRRRDGFRVWRRKAGTAAALRKAMVRACG